MPLFPLGFTLLDAYGRVTTRSFKVDAVDFAAAAIAAAAFVVDYEAVSELALYESRLTDVDLFATSPTAGANRDEGMTLSVQLDTPGKKASVQVPGPAAAVRLADGSIDMTHALITALEANYSSGSITASDGETVTGFIKGTLDK